MNSTVRNQDRYVKNMFSPREIAVLKCLRDLAAAGRGSTPVEIHEIAQLTETRDSDEVLRALYTLEGKSLVEPDPAGDLTSSRWRVTVVGMKAADLIGE